MLSKRTLTSSSASHAVANKQDNYKGRADRKRKKVENPFSVSRLPDPGNTETKFDLKGVVSWSLKDIPNGSNEVQTITKFPRVS